MFNINKCKYDITIAVWNRFWSDDLAKGLMLAGYRVLMIGSARRYPKGSSYIISWPALMCMQLQRFAPKQMRRNLIRLSRMALGKTAHRYALTSPVFWAWNGFNEPGMRLAKANNRIVVSEVGSTHVRWQRRILEAEYRTLNLLPKLDSLKDIGKACLEWNIADYICVPSAYIADTYVEQGISPKKLAINAFGIDVNFWREASISSTLLNKSDEIVFVFSGHANLRKGIHYLLEAWQRAALPNARLLVVGGCDDYGNQLIQTAPSNVCNMGRLSHDDMRKLYTQCDVYIFPSLEEGMARSCLEAMAAGLPMIITRESGLSEIMKEGEDGWFVPAADSDALADRIRYAASLRKNELHKMGLSAQKRVRNMTREAYGKRAANFLEEILTGNTPSNLYKKLT